MLLLIFLLFILIILISIVLYNGHERRVRLIRKIPGPKSWPLIGNITSFILPPDKLFSFNRSLMKQFGNVIQIHGFNTYIVRVTHPTDIEALLSNTTNKQFPYTLVSCWLQDGLLLSNGNKWHLRRKILTKAFHFNILKRFLKSFVDEMDNLLEKVQKEIGKKRTEVMPLMSNSALRILCDTTMGLREDMQTSMKHYFKTLNILGNCFSKRLSKAWYRLDFFFQFSDIAKEQNKAVLDVHNFTNTVIKKRRDYFAGKVNPFDELSDKYDANEKLGMLDLLLKEEQAGFIDNDGIKEEVNTFLFAGHDTTATAMTFTIMAIANEPEIQEKIYKEICEIFKDSDRSITIEDLNEMKYLGCCIKESLRLYPSVPIIARHLEKDVVLGGYTVPANTTCMVSIFDVHRREDLYPNPERFIPERFLSDGPQRHPYAYMPFSIGSRNCIGQKFAILEMKTIISELLRRYRLEPVTKPEDLVFRTDLVLNTIHPVYVKFCVR